MHFSDVTQASWHLKFCFVWLTHWGRDKMAAMFKWISFNENVWISIEVSLKFVPKGPINNIPTLVQIMAWPRPGNKPLSEPMMVSFLTHICVTQPQWVKMAFQILLLIKQFIKYNNKEKYQSSPLLPFLWWCRFPSQKASYVEGGSIS